MHLASPSVRTFSATHYANTIPHTRVYSWLHFQEAEINRLPHGRVHSPENDLEPHRSEANGASPGYVSHLSRNLGNVSSANPRRQWRALHRERIVKPRLDRLGVSPPAASGQGTRRRCRPRLRRVVPQAVAPWRETASTRSVVQQTPTKFATIPQRKPSIKKKKKKTAQIRVRNDRKIVRNKKLADSMSSPS